MYRNTDPDTSVDAGNVNFNALREAAYNVIANRPCGATTAEIAEELGTIRDSISPRMPALVTEGRVKDSGIRRVGNRGRKQIVWMKV